MTRRRAPAAIVLSAALAWTACSSGDDAALVRVGDGGGSTTTSVAVIGPGTSALSTTAPSPSTGGTAPPSTSPGGSGLTTLPPGTVPSYPWLAPAGSMPNSLGAGTCPNSATVYPWQGTFAQQSVDTGVVRGTLFTPLQGSGPFPAIVVEHGTGGNECVVWWIARALAGHGYIALAVNTSGSTAHFANQASDAIDFLVSDANPARARTDTARIGAAGHSQGAFAVEVLQETDARVSAIAALDWLVPGDGLNPPSESPCVPPVDHVITPRVPALSESRDTPCPGGASGSTPQPRDKLVAYDRWRAAGVPSFVFVFAGTAHSDWNNATGEPAVVEAFAWYTVAWFDRWLRGDGSAGDRLLARAIPSNPSAAALLSTKYESAAAFDGHDCPDLRACVG